MHDTGETISHPPFDHGHDHIKEPGGFTQTRTRQRLSEDEAALRVLEIYLAGENSIKYKHSEGLHYASETWTWDFPSPES